MFTILVKPKSAASKVARHKAESKQGLELAAPSDVYVQVKAKDVKEYLKEGEDLILVQSDGQSVRLAKFFSATDGQASELYLQNAQNDLLAIELVEQVPGCPLVAHSVSGRDLDRLAEAFAAAQDDSGVGILPWLLAGAGAALLAGRSGGDDDGPRTVMPAPTAIRQVSDDAGSVTGALTPGALTDDATPTVSGTAAPGASVSVYVDGKPVGAATADANGNWRLPLPALTEGQHTITTEVPPGPGVTPTAGGTPSNPGFTLTVDTTPPTAPTIKAVDDNAGATQGPVAPNGSTDDKTPTLSGSGEPGSTITILDGSTPLGTAVVDPGGNWTFTPATPLADGPHTFNTVATDGAGNTTPGPGVTLTVDTAPPVAPTIDGVTDNAGATQGPVAPNGSTDDATPTLTGKGEPGSTVTVRDGTTPLGTAVVDGAGNWSFTPNTPLADGSHTFDTVATDAAGNATPGASITLTVDTTAPAAPTIFSVNDNAGPIQGPVPANGSTDDNTPTLVGTGEPGATITILDGSTRLGTAVVDADGNWSFTPAVALGDGLHTFNTVATDAAGNATAGASTTLTVDTNAGAGPVITSVSDNVGAIQGPVANNGSTDDATPALAGTGEPGTTVTILEGSTPLGTALVDGAGNWSFTPSTPLADGTHTLTTLATDGVGNTTPGGSTTLTVDTSAPAAPAITSVDDNAGATQGPLAAGDSTDDNTPTLVGTGEPGATITVLDGSTPLGTALVDGAGNWTFTPPLPLVDGSRTFNTVASDAAGNTTPGDSFALTIDTLPSTGTTGITQVLDDQGPLTGPLANGATTNDSTPTLTGVGDPGSTVTIADGLAVLGTTLVDGSGNWTFTPAAPLADGNHSFTATGPTNTSSAFAVTVDTVAPPAPAITSMADDVPQVTGSVGTGGTTNDPALTLSGTGEPGSTVRVLDGTTEVGSALVDGAGNWSLTTSNLADGAHALTAVAVDSAGNTSAPSPAWNVTVDTVAPPTPVISAIGGFDVAGSAEPGSLVGLDLNRDGSIDHTTTAAADGSYNFVLPSALASGTPLSVTATDAAGNASAPALGVAPATVTPNTATTPNSLLYNRSLLGLGTSITGQAAGAETVTLYVYQSGDLLQNFLSPVTVNVDPAGNFVIDGTLLSTLLNGVVNTLAGSTGMYLGIQADAAVPGVQPSPTAQVYIGEVADLLTDPAAAINSLLGALLGGSVSMPVVAYDYQGTAANDVFTGTAISDVMDGGDGNDVLSSGSGGTADPTTHAPGDILSGGLGNDALIVQHTGFTAIDGGAGRDVLLLDAGISLDTTTMAGAISNIEVVDMARDTAANTLTLDASTVLAMTDGNRTLTIRGDSNDTLSLLGTGGTPATKTGTTTIDGETYDIYAYGGNLLYVDQHIGVVPG